MTPLARKRGCLARLAITAGAFAVGALSVELAMRALDIRPPEPFVRSGGTLTHSDDPVLIFENNPGAVERLEYRDRAGDAPRVVEMRVNAQGFRGREVALEKPPGTFRIACVGDSHTFGFGVADGETWPVELERWLREHDPARSFEVLNCGVDAYDTLQEAVWLERKVLAYQPDLVLLQYYVNDTAFRDDSAPPPDVDWLFQLAQPRREGFVRALRERSVFADFVLDGVYRRRGLAVYSELRMSGYREDAPGWRRVVEGLTRARDRLGEREIGFAVVLYPFLVREGDRLTSHDAFQQVAAWCARERVACFDAESAFLEHDVDELRISAHDYHGNPRANAIFARAVGAWLSGAGSIDR